MSFTIQVQFINLVDVFIKNKNRYKANKMKYIKPKKVNKIYIKKY